MRQRPKISPYNATQMELMEDFTFNLAGTTHVILAGTVFDGASIPWIARPIIGSPFSPRFIEAALVHDYCCVFNLDGDLRDAKFKDILRINSVSKIKSGAMHKAVVGYRWLVNKFNF